MGSQSRRDLTSHSSADWRKSATSSFRLWPRAGKEQPSSMSKRSNELDFASTVGRSLHSIKSTVPFAAFHQLETLLFLHRCSPSLTASTPIALLITADLPTLCGLV